MTSKLSSLLVQDGVVSVKCMEEAFQRQVIYGGELDTVLFEMGALDEAGIARFLHLASGLPPGDLSELKLEDLSPPTDVFPRKLAEKYRVVPVHREGNRLLVVVTVAIERGQLEELSFMLNMALVPNVVPEMRVVQLLDAVYDIPVPRRFAVLLEKYGDPPALRNVGVPARLLTPTAPPAEPETAPETGAAEKKEEESETAPEDEFGAGAEEAEEAEEEIKIELQVSQEVEQEKGEIWAQGDLGAVEPDDLVEDEFEKEDDQEQSLEDFYEDEAVPGSSMQKSSTIVGMPVGPEAEVAYNERAEFSGRPLSGMEKTPSFSSPPALEMDDFPKIIQPQQFAREAKGEIDLSARTREAERESGDDVSPSVEVDLPPSMSWPILAESKVPEKFLGDAIDIKDAEAEFNVASNRDEILQVLVKIMASKCKYAALFVVHGDHAAGKYVVKDGRFDTSGVGRVEIPLKSKSLFKTVVETGSQYFGPVDDVGLNYAVLTQLDRLDAPNVLAVPVKIKDRVVCVLYGDGGKDLVSSDAVADLAPLPFLGAAAFMRILVDAKKGYGKARASGEERIDKAEASLPDKRAAVMTNETGPAGAGSSGAKDLLESGTAQGGWDTGPAREDLKESVRPEAVYVDVDDRPVGTVTVDAGEAPERFSREGFEGLVDVLEAGGEMGERAASMLSKGGEEGLAAVMKRFPGRLVVDRFAPGAKLPPVSRHGPILHFLVWYGSGAVGNIMPMLESEDPEKRFYAALLFTEIVSDEVLGLLYQKLFDADASVRRAAVEALKVNAGEEKMTTVLEYLRGVLQQGVPFHRACAAEAVGILRDQIAVSMLISMVDDESRQVSEAVQRALLLITKQAFGGSKSEWLSWWSRNGEKHRVEWMIDSLVHPDVECRFMAAKELKELSGETFGYRFDLPLNERQLTVGRWREWWSGPGGEKFKRF